MGAAFCGPHIRLSEGHMAKKKRKSSAEIKEKRREAIAKKNKISSIIAYSVAGAAVLVIIGLIIYTYLK